MSERFLTFWALFALALGVTAACGGSEDDARAPTGGGGDSAVATETGATPTTETTGATGDKACLLFQGNVADRGFNQSAWEGAQSGGSEVGLGAQYVAVGQESEQIPAFRAFLEQPCEIIVTVGFTFTDTTKQVATENPDRNFAIVDVSYTPPIPNVRGLVFDEAQSSFLAGYLAAGMSESGVVGVYGGVKIPPVTLFMDGYAQGIDYYNETKGTDVQLLGWDLEKQDGTFVGNFTDASKGKQIAKTMMQQGADVIFGLGAGPDFGAAEAIQSEGNGEVMMIWPNHDGCIAVPKFCDVILTTVEKDVEVVVDQAVKDAGNGTFEGGTYLGTLENRGVGLSPFHEFEDDVPAELKAELDTIREQIISGEIEVTSASLPE